MTFSRLEEFHQSWRDILVIGKTIEQDNRKYHIIGMTLSDEVRLYAIEAFSKPEKPRKKGIHNQRRLLKEPEEPGSFLLNCSCCQLGLQRLQIQGGTGAPLTYSADDYGTIQLFFDMMSVGWTVPEWLKKEDWDNLQLVTLNIGGLKKLPKYSPDMPVTITYRPTPKKHFVEKTVTLTIGKSRSFSFVDAYGDKVQCHINQVSLIDVWKTAKEQLNNLELAKKVSPDELKRLKEHSHKALKQVCKKGMCYVGIEYECSKDLNLVFYSKQYLSSRPEVHRGSSFFILMNLKPDQGTGTHQLPLKGCVIQTPVPPDTSRIVTELFLYYEKQF